MMAAWAQARPDLSGTWTFHEAKSDAAPARGGRGGGGRGGGKVTIESKDVYTRDANVLTIESTRTTPNGSTTRKLIYTKN